MTLLFLVSSPGAFIESGSRLGKDAILLESLKCLPQDGL